MKRIVIMAGFPIHEIPAFGIAQGPGHYATWLPQLSRSFAGAQDFDIHWVFLSRALGGNRSAEWNGQTFHCLHSPSRLKALRGYREDVRLLHQTISALAPDLVHAWGTEECYGLAAALSNRRWLLSMQGIFREYCRRVRMHPLEYLQMAYEWYILKKARNISVESKWGGAAIRKLAPQATIYLVEYGVQEIFFETVWKPEASRARAVFVGSPNARKGIQDAIRAFADPKLAEAELCIVGDTGGTYAEGLRRASGTNVRWLGRLGPAETAAVLQTAWCLVLPTRADTSPNVVKEARVMGLPVVTTREGGQADYIEDGVTGYLVDPGDIETLADRLAELLGSLEKAKQLGSNEHEAQRAWFRPERTAENFLRLYQRLA